VWQQHSDLLQAGRAGPPIVTRLWVDAKKMPRSAAEAFEMIDRNDPALRHLCAVKIPAHQLYEFP
jgi:hypothetical protein